jgi:poly(beta-D-mannuronate) lyase
MELTGVYWYEDKKGSVPDPGKQAENLLLQKDIRNFTDGLSDRLDRLVEGTPDPRVVDCIQRNLLAWTQAGALLRTPTWSVPIAEQTKAAVALQFIFLKLKAIGVQAPREARRWQYDSLVAVLKAYGPGTSKSNMYVWSGVAAAAGDLVERHDDLRTYHEAAWRFAIDAIADDGTVAVEMERGQRALVYHTFFYNAASALWNLRNALGIDTSPADAAALRRLGKAVGDAACQPSEFARRAGAQQEPLDRWNLAMAWSFAARFNSDAWKRCTKAPDRFPGAGWGGRFDLTVKSMERTSSPGK